MDKYEVFENVAKKWLDRQAFDLKPSSVVKYNNILNLYLITKYKDMDIGKISRKDIKDYISELVDNGGKDKKGLSTKTVNSIISVMKNILDYANRELNINVANIDDLFIKDSHKDMRILSIREQRQLSKYLYQDLSLCNLGILICMYTGLRIGEICALKWQDIYLSDRYIYVNKTMGRIQTLDNSKMKTKIIISPPKSTSSIRKIPIPNEILNILRNYKVSEEAYLLTGSEIKYIEPRNMENHFKAVIKKCGIENVTFHTLRHTFATRCVELGFDIKSLSEILGHASVNITLNRYVHPSMKMKEENMNRLSGLIRGEEE